MKQIRAVFDEKNIRVYQAYNEAIAESAIRSGRFISPPFKKDRMTWIKPSFLWMMYRAGWGHKDAGQARILAIDISREGFEWALANSCLSHPPSGMPQDEWADMKASSCVRIQWDPERNLTLDKLEHRSIQIGLSGDAVEHYISSWIQNITDITETAHSLCGLVQAGKLDAAIDMLPDEQPYDVSDKLALTLGIV
ncbi:MAG: DUF4291 domain-containing protein [Hellea sp.]